MFVDPSPRRLLSRNDSHGDSVPIRSPRGSIYEGSVDETRPPSSQRIRKISQQLSDPSNVTASGALSTRGLSPRPPLCRMRTSLEALEGEAIRIIIDDVDCDRQRRQTSRSTIQVARLRRDPNQSSSHGFRAFGLDVTSTRQEASGGLFDTVITYVETNSTGHRAGLRCGDTVLCWDGVRVINFEKALASSRKIFDTSVAGHLRQRLLPDRRLCATQFIRHLLA